MEEQQVAQPQPPAQPPIESPAQSPITPVPRKKFPWKKLILILIAFIIVFGGIGSILAWRTSYLDPYLPSGVKEFFGRGEEEEEPVPPVISSVKVKDITETSATITWTTDVEATSQVEYGTTSSYGSQTQEDTTLVLSHSVTLSKLTKGAFYYFLVKSKDGSGNLAVSEDFTFSTVDPFKDWNTYTNTTLGFSIKYPGAVADVVEVSDEEAAEVNFYEKGAYPGKYPKMAVPWLVIRVYQNTTGRTGVDWIENDSPIRGLLATTAKGVTWNRSDDWYVSSDTISTLGPEYYAYGFFNTRVFELSATLQMVNQVLSTFKFL